jgi:hypothetical protein
MLSGWCIFAVAKMVVYAPFAKVCGGEFAIANGG